MKARVELMIRDEEGKILGHLDSYSSELGKQSLYEIEGAVEDYRLSYEEVGKLIERVSGSRLLRDQKISKIVSDKALQLSQDMQEDAARILDTTDIKLIKINPKVDIDNPESPEILLFDDGIQVKRQKSYRESKAKQEGKFGSKSSD